MCKEYVKVFVNRKAIQLPKRRTILVHETPLEK